VCRSKLSTANLSEEERDLVQRFIAAHERGDAAGLAALMRKDVRATMPPNPLCFEGLESFAPLFDRAFG
jgi:ketosteroid isomerase-like protein